MIRPNHIFLFCLLWAFAVPFCIGMIIHFIKKLVAELKLSQQQKFIDWVFEFYLDRPPLYDELRKQIESEYINISPGPRFKPIKLRGENE